MLSIRERLQSCRRMGRPGSPGVDPAKETHPRAATLGILDPEFLAPRPASLPEHARHENLAAHTTHRPGC